MRLGWRRLVLACLAAASAIVVLVPGGSAGNRTAEASFGVVPGPARVSGGENIAYRATFTNVGKSTFTHVIFRQQIPSVTDASGAIVAEARFVASTCPVTPVVVRTPHGAEWTCDFGKLKPGHAGIPQLVLTVVWKAPTLGGSGSCEGCLVTNGRWTIKEGVHDKTDVNDAFPPGGVTVAASIVSAQSTSEATGYETNAEPCTDPFEGPNLRTDPALDAEGNPVSTALCLPSPIPSDAVNLGVSAAIVEGPSEHGDPGHAAFGRSNVCIAALGEACDEDYTPQDFSPNVTTVVLRGSAAALGPHEVVTKVFHNGHELPPCPSADPNGCVVSITLDHETGVWTAVVEAPTNGFYNW